MKKTCLFSGIALAVCAAGVLTLAAQDSKKEIPAGMEIIKAGTIEMIVPKGMKTKTHGNFTMLEDANEFLARRLLDMDQRIEKIEGTVDKMSESLKELQAVAKNNFESIDMQLEKIRKALPKKEGEEQAP